MGDGQIALEDFEMLKALYDFEATLAKTLSFTEGEFFLLHQTNTKQRNWWHVVNTRGKVGFVPSNYVATVKVDPEFYMTFLNECIKSLNNEVAITPQKQELLARMMEKRHQIKAQIKPSKKPQAPKPPPRLDDHTPPNGMTPSLDMKPVMQQQKEEEETSSSKVAKENEEPKRHSSGSKLSSYQHSSDQEDSSSESIRPNAIYEIVQSVRKETQLSHEMSKVAVETVLVSLREFLPGGAARSIIDALLREAASNMSCPEGARAAAPDALRMSTALAALAAAARDAQQRGWALHDDAHDIQTQLLELISVMSNADVSISQHVLSSHKYAYVTTLVQYYQMETRWPLRQLLLQAFGVMCGLERTALLTLVQSQLPAEIARDMRDNPVACTRLSHSALLLSMLLSMADKMPVTHFEQLGVEFAQFLLELIENPPETDVDEQLPDLLLALLLAYNLQFGDDDDNLLLRALEARDNAKVFCEKLLLLLNREDDPVRMFDHQPAPPHSVLRLARCVLNSRRAARHLYTNDAKVAVDIVVRQLADLSPPDERRQQYLWILRGLVRHTECARRLPRRADLLRCFARISCEEGAASRADQALVRAISNEFPHYFNT